MRCFDFLRRAVWLLTPALLIPMAQPVFQAHADDALRTLEIGPQVTVTNTDRNASIALLQVPVSLEAQGNESAVSFSLSWDTNRFVLATDLYPPFYMPEVLDWLEVPAAAGPANGPVWESSVSTNVHYGVDDSRATNGLATFTITLTNQARLLAGRKLMQMVQFTPVGGKDGFDALTRAGLTLSQASAKSTNGATLPVTVLPYNPVAPEGTARQASLGNFTPWTDTNGVGHILVPVFFRPSGDENQVHMTLSVATNILTQPKARIPYATNWMVLAPPPEGVTNPPSATDSTNAALVLYGSPTGRLEYVITLPTNAVLNPAPSQFDRNVVELDFIPAPGLPNDLSTLARARLCLTNAMARSVADTNGVRTNLPVTTLIQPQSQAASLSPRADDQTGLRYQLVTVANATTQSLPGVGVWVYGLGTNQAEYPYQVRVQNAASVGSGYEYVFDGTNYVIVANTNLPYFEFGPLAAGASVDLTVEIHDPTRTNTIVPRYVTVPLSSYSYSLTATNEVRVERALFTNGVFYLEFSTDKGATYYVEYSDNFDPTNNLTSVFTSADLLDLPALAAKLNQRADPVTTYVVGRLSATTTAALGAYQPTNATSVANLQTALVADLNAIIGGASIYDTNRFASVGLRTETKLVLAQEPQGNALLRLNRLLLEDAYPFELSREPARVWLVSLPGIAGTGGHVQWVDNGPPRTQPKPVSQTTRFYRVIKP